MTNGSVPLNDSTRAGRAGLENEALMRQILMNSGGAVVARVPRPAVEPGSVLVRVHYSLISVGTEIAPLKAPLAATPDGATSVEKGVAYANLATH